MAQLQTDNERLWQEWIPVKLSDPGLGSANIAWPITTRSAEMSVGAV